MCRGEQKVKNRNFANDLIPGPHPQQVDHLNKRGILTDPVSKCIFRAYSEKCNAPIFKHTMYQVK